VKDENVNSQGQVLTTDNHFQLLNFKFACHRHLQEKCL